MRASAARKRWAMAAALFGAAAWVVAAPLLSAAAPEPAGATAGASAAAERWGFRPPVRPDAPAVRNASWVRNPIDRFVLARLEREGLGPSPEADRYTLVRRLYLDLIGLPPTPAEADAFVSDRRPDAWERLVDGLLDSPHYGEHWALRWLDLARYADTNGYEKDRERSIWPWRDWVIRALNEDMPFDRFTVEQLAGDMLPGAALRQRVATGFHRNTMTNEEGGIDVEEFRYESVVDRVNTTGTVWLGLTIGCAQCHDHKYDPIGQREYYELMAFFNNADEPEIPVPDPNVAKRRAALRERIDNVRAAMRRRLPELQEDFAEWRRDTAASATRWTVLRPMKLSSEYRATMEVLDDGSVLVSGDKPNFDTYTVELPTELRGVTALRLELLPHESLPDGGPGRAPLFSVGDFLLSEIEVAAAPLDGEAGPRPVKLHGATESYTQEDRSAAAALDGRLDTGWSIKGRTGEPHHAVFQLGQPVDHEGGAKLTVTLVQRYIHQMTIGRFRISATVDEPPIESAGVPAEVEAALLLPEAELRADQRRLLEDHFLSVTPELEAEQKKIAELRASMPHHPTTMVMRERRPRHARTTRIHHRGEFLKPGEPVEPDIPAALPALPAEATRHRLTLARWLVDESGAGGLTARVVMNRHWRAFFGDGLVRTPQDFGAQGERPTHPALLDWLATEFIRRGWSLKRMHRLIVTSAAYRQASRLTPELLERDPENRLLARGSRFRVDGETFRDIALTGSGLLTRRLGGPSVFPPQPEGVTDLSYGAMEWRTDTGADRYRRGLYTFRKRTSPYAMFTLFGAPSGERCVVARERSNTPLQALTVLNDTVFIEAAQAAARSILREGPSDTAGRVERLFRLFLTRPPDQAERQAMLDFHQRQLARFRAGELDAAEVAGMNEQQAAERGFDPADLAAWTALARAILNLDETITKG